jgi:peptide/nickel transport system permease protein
MTATVIARPGGGGSVPRRARPRPRTGAAARYLARKLGFYVIAAWVALTLNFFLPRLIPGNPVEIIMAHQAHFGTVPPGEAASLTKLLGLGSGSIFVQYWQYLDSLAHLRLGLSVYEFPVPVATVIRQSILWTILLVGAATVISFAVGITLGVLAGWKRGTWLDNLVPATTFLTAMPYFWLALLWCTCSPRCCPCCPPRAGTTRWTTSGSTGSSSGPPSSTRSCRR